LNCAMAGLAANTPPSELPDLASTGSRLASVRGRERDTEYSVQLLEWPIVQRPKITSERAGACS
jgi:hypothetical protein